MREGVFNRATRDLTQGRVQPHVWYLAIPLMGAMILQTGINVIDMFWLGKLGAGAIAAVTMGGTLFLVMTTFMVGLSTGTVAMIARAVGKNDKKSASDIAIQAMNMAIVTYIIFGGLGFALSPTLLKIVGATEEILPEATQYLRIMFIGGIFIFLFLLGSSILRGVGDTLTPMIILACVALLNAILDPLLIFGIGFPRLEVKGAALANLISQMVGVIILFYFLTGKHSRAIISLSHYKLNWDIMIRIFRIGMPYSLQVGSRSLMWVALMVIISGFGTQAIAAYGITIRILMLILLTSFSFGNASATLVGQNLGIGKPQRAEKSALIAAGYDTIIMIFLSVIFFIFADKIIGVFNKDHHVIAIGTSFMRIISPSFIPIAVAIVLGRALGGAGETVAPMLVTFVALWGIQIPLAYFLTQTSLGLDGAWIAMTIANVLQAIMICVVFFRGNWKNKKI